VTWQRRGVAIVAPGDRRNTARTHEAKWRALAAWRGTPLNLARAMRCAYANGYQNIDINLHARHTKNGRDEGEGGGAHRVMA